MILIRHGQSHFNLHYGRTRQDPGIIDPGLTEEGVRQIDAAAESLRGGNIRRLIASPYTRTLETASIIASQLGLPVEIEPLVREQAAFACDVGTPRAQLAARWKEIDFSMLEAVWWYQGRESDAELQQRCAGFRAVGQDFEDQHQVLVVTHWAFIRGLTGSAVANGTLLDFDPAV